MVFFNCNACGEALKKNQVEKHYQLKCRRCEVLSCVDCQKEFWGDTYKEHTKCISEEEKYSGKNWKPKENANKGEKKQEAWIQQVLDAIANCPPGKPKLRELLRSIQDYPNIPRKKAKFENFVKNSMRVRDTRLVTEAWDVLSAEANKAQVSETPDKEATNGEVSSKTVSESDSLIQTDQSDDLKKLSKRERKEERRKKQHKAQKKDKQATQADGEGAQKAKKSKKRRREEEEEEEAQDEKPEKRKKKKLKSEANGHAEVETGENIREKKKKRKKAQDEDSVAQEEVPASTVTEEEETSPRSEGTFQWDASIMAVMNKASDNEISLKKLKKKILCEFHACGGDGKTYTEEKMMSRLTKHVLRNPRLRVHKERVKLTT